MAPSSPSPSLSLSSSSSSSSLSSASGPIEVTTIACRDGTTLPLWRVGSRRASRAIILCHGFVQNAHAWSVPSRSLSTYLHSGGRDPGARSAVEPGGHRHHDDADDNVAVYLMEVRGRRSATAHHDLLTTVDQDAVAVVDAVAARHARVAWVGHSMGGLIGAALPPPAADRLAALCVLGSPLLPGRTALHGRAVISSLLRFGRAMGARGSAFDGARYARGFVVGRRLLDTPVATLTPLPLWRPGSFVDDADLHHTLAHAFANDSHDVFADLIDLVRTNGVHAGRLPMTARLQGLRAPLLAIAGTVDALAPPDSVHALYARAGSANKTFLEVNAGHIDLVVGDDAPRTVWGPLREFLDEHLGSRR